MPKPSRPTKAKAEIRMAEGSGTAATPTAEVELPIEERVELEPLTAVSLIEPAELIPAPNGPVDASESDKSTPLGWAED
jgi:hypothetical protein